MLDWFKDSIKSLFRGSKNKKQIVDFVAFKETIGYDIVDEELFIQALKHRSYLPITQEQRIHSNERLELLGDAVLGLVVVDFLYQRYPNKEEGELTNMKSLFVSRRILAKIARTLKLGQYMLISDAEERSGGRKRASINSDAMEAIIGAIYLDGGLSSARIFVEEKFGMTSSLLCTFVFTTPDVPSHCCPKPRFSLSLAYLLFTPILINVALS